jgi:hypothetical protein
MCAEIPWDAPSRFGPSGRLARRLLARLLRPALTRQASINADLRARLDDHATEIAALKVAMSGHATMAHLGELQYRIDVMERRCELAPARAMLTTAKVPEQGERVTAVKHHWGPADQRRVLCSSGTGEYVSLLEVSAIGLETYARRHGWDLVLSREELARGRPEPWGKIQLVRDLLHQYDLVAWIDSDAIIVDFRHDLGEVVEPAKDFYLVEQQSDVDSECVLNSGVFVARASEWTQRFLAEVWAQADLIDHRWWENAAIMRLLGYDIDLSPVTRGTPSPWIDRVKFLDLAWNSIPYWSRSPLPRINHYGALTVPRRRLMMLDDLTQVFVKRRTPDPLADVDSRDDLPILFNRLGFIGTGVEVGVQAGSYSAWILHRWWGWRLISVDPWTASPESEHVDIANVEQERHDALFALTASRLAPFGARSVIWRMTGDEAVTHIADASLDFVYLDASHDQGSVASDLATWERKLKSGGILAGHYYLDADLPEGQFGVKTAVDKFFAARGRKVNETAADRPWPSWWVLLP